MPTTNDQNKAADYVILKLELSLKKQPSQEAIIEHAHRLTILRRATKSSAKS